MSFSTFLLSFLSFEWNCHRISPNGYLHSTIRRIRFFFISSNGMERWKKKSRIRYINIFVSRKAARENKDERIITVFSLKVIILEQRSTRLNDTRTSIFVSTCKVPSITGSLNVLTCLVKQLARPCRMETLFIEGLGILMPGRVGVWWAKEFIKALTNARDARSTLLSM